MLDKPNKLDYTSVKVYRVISLLNCLGKVFEKLVADILAEWCEIIHLLHSGQIGLTRQRSTIDPVTQVTNRIQEAWAQGKLEGILVMDIKSTFNNVRRNCLLQTIERIDADSDLMQRTESLILGRSMSLVIDGYLYEETAFHTGVARRSQVPTVLFAIYESEVLTEVELEVE